MSQLRERVGFGSGRLRTGATRQAGRRQVTASHRRHRPQPTHKTLLKQRAFLSSRTRVKWSEADELQIATLAAVKSVLRGFDLLVALWCDGKPMLLSRVPVQIAILDGLAYVQKPRAIWRRWFCFFCFSHTIS
jgi:hypothetical protein